MTNPNSGNLPTLAMIGAGSRGIHCYGSYMEKNRDKGRIVAVAEPRSFQRTELSRRHGIPEQNQFEDWRELLAGPRLADAVIIATTDRHHIEPVLAAVAKGYHILLEKPMAPTLEECRAIVRAVDEAGVSLVVCHVLRYASFYSKIKEILDSGQLGELCSIQHLEGVAWWHFAHSFVRGNFGNEARSSFVLLAKCCHDVDILRWWVGKPCLRVSSFGSVKHFRAESAPPNAALRCMDCELADKGCPYSAKKYYFERLRNEKFVWPLNMVIDHPDEAALEDALRIGPYGRCVYHCDNDVVDSQVVNFEFEGGVTASMTMSAFTPSGRRVRLMGSRGYLEGDEHVIRILDYESDSWTEYDVNTLASDLTGGHGGGDQRMMGAFLEMLAGKGENRITTGADVSLESHIMVFAAEKARKEARVVQMAELMPETTLSFSEPACPAAK